MTAKQIDWWARGFLAMVLWGAAATVTIVCIPFLLTGPGVIFAALAAIVLGGGAWLAGGLLVGLPVWLGAHRFGVRKLSTIMIAAALISGLGGIGLGWWVDGEMTKPTGLTEEAWLTGGQTIRDGRLTAFGEAQQAQTRLWTLIAFGGIAAVSGLSSGYGLWRYAYRPIRPPQPPPPAPPS